MTDPKRIVEQGYDAIAPRYAEWASSFDAPTGAWVDRLLARLPPRSRVLDLGCGNGSIVAQRIVAAGHSAVGVNISRAQLERAAANVPELELVKADALEVELAPASFDAIVSTFVFGHIPRAEQLPLLERCRRWLRPAGLMLLTMGIGGSADVVEEDWLGAPMFFASFDDEMNHRLVSRAGFDVEEARVVPFHEPGHGRVAFQWFLARRR
jgi:cyclopropane fatty-acyl-phospholipid synthase-like methyltransferase